MVQRLLKSTMNSSLTFSNPIRRCQNKYKKNKNCHKLNVTIRSGSDGKKLTITQIGDNGQVNGTLRILITLTLISLAPMLLIMLTSFTRIIIVLH
mgnify:CR=1 FL=1